MAVERREMWVLVSDGCPVALTDLEDREDARRQLGPISEPTEKVVRATVEWED